MISDVSTPPAKWYRRLLDNNYRVFGLLWLITFIIYLPAAKAGWVLDSAGWLWNVKNLPFKDYVNNTQSIIPSLYQFTQVATWIFYKIFGANRYAWHVLMVTMQATNAWLLFLLCFRIFADTAVRNSRNIALAGVLLYTVCPHISEVVVWESAYHYLQGFLFILLILIWVQKYFHTGQQKYAWIAGLVYLCSTYSLEIFYLTPWFVLSLAFYYRYALNYDQAVFRKVISRFFLPQLIMFALHLVVLMAVYRQVAHIGSHIWQPLTNYLCKPPRYIFHILFFGRFFPIDVRQQVYQVIGSNAGLIIFYNIVVLICVHIVSRFRVMSGKAKASSLVFVWTIMSTAILLPLAFPTLLLVNFDRYTYFLDGFTYVLLALLVSYISLGILTSVLFIIYAAVNLYFTIKLNLYWKQSAYITTRLIKELPDPGNKIVVLLNPPQSYKGIPMIGADPDGEYKKLHELFVGKIPNKVYDAAAYNMNAKDDGANVIVANDTVVKVTLNQWGTWWWYQAQGGISYENEDYVLYMRDMGHWYDLKLKHPPEDYLLLYNVGDRWKIVNWNKKREPQY